MPNSAPSFMDTDLPLKWEVDLVDLPDKAITYLSPEAIDLNEDGIDVSFSALEPLLLTKVDGKAQFKAEISKDALKTILESGESYEQVCQVKLSDGTNKQTFDFTVRILIEKVKHEANSESQVGGSFIIPEAE